ncbi:MAG: HAMP domain-containing histidine kinase [Lachnospiraceae bacterium]|nr:HAMP domain-containing histidine kinase [Lachnospiraceae bacterium]
MLWAIIAVLAIGEVYFAARYFGLQNGLGQAAEDLKEIRENPEANRTLKINEPNGKLESFLEEVNDWLRLAQKERIEARRREQVFCREIEHISHDLRTPLTSILGYVNLMDRDLLPQEAGEYLEVVERKAKELEKLTEDFYALTRLEIGEYQLEAVRLDINRALNERALDYYPAFERRNVEVLMFTKEEPVWILGDESAVERIFNNLLHNMTKYARGLAEICLRTEGAFVNIEFVNDAGSIKEEEANRIFERFYMADVSRTGHSSGLGLPIARSLAREMGGDITAVVERDYPEEMGETKKLKIVVRLPKAQARE